MPIRPLPGKQVASLDAAAKQGATKTLPLTLVLTMCCVNAHGGARSAV